jgi:hypothetical protein
LVPDDDIRIYGTNVPERESGTVTGKKNIWTLPEIQMIDFLGRVGRVGRVVGWVESVE